MHSGRPQHVAAEVLAQILRGSQIHWTSAKDDGQLCFNASKTKEARLLPGHELHQKIDVAVARRRSLRKRSEERQPANVMAPGRASARASRSKDTEIMGLSFNCARSELSLGSSGLPDRDESDIAIAGRKPVGKGP